MRKFDKKFYKSYNITSKYMYNTSVSTNRKPIKLIKPVKPIHETKLEFPIFDGKESITSFMRRVSQFNIDIKKQKYDKILEFVNEIMSTPDTKKYTSLTDF